MRTRVLQFALQIQDELPDDDDKAIEALPPAVVDRVVNVTIMGGNNVFGTVHQFQPTTVIAGDIASLRTALEGLSVTRQEIADLEATLQEDGSYAVGEAKAIGDKTNGWIASTAKKVASAGLKITSAVAEEVIKGYVKGYMGLP